MHGVTCRLGIEAPPPLPRGGGGIEAHQRLWPSGACVAPARAAPFARKMSPRAKPLGRGGSRTPRGRRCCPGVGRGALLRQSAEARLGSGRTNILRAERAGLPRGQSVLQLQLPSPVRHCPPPPPPHSSALVHGAGDLLCNPLQGLTPDPLMQCGPATAHHYRGWGRGGRGGMAAWGPPPDPPTHPPTSPTKMRLIKGARNWRSILGPQTVFLGPSPPPPPPPLGRAATSHKAVV